jgi:hypothetical protein
MGFSPRQRSTGENAAFGQRHRRTADARFKTYRLLRIAGKRPVRAFPDYLEFSPAPTDPVQFADLSTRVNTYLRDAGLPLFLPGPRFELTPDLVPHFAPELVKDPGWVDVRPAGRPYRLVHRLQPGAVRDALTSRTRTVFVDTDLHTFSEMEYFAARREASWPTYAPAEMALDRVLAIRGKSAFILATGPSALTVDLSAVDADVRITCNSAVRDLEKIKEFRPHIICFTDPVFHFGPSRYAAAFRDDLVRAAEAVDAIVVCGDQFVGPLLGMRPELADRLAVFPQQLGGSWRWPAPRNPTLRLSGNVLTDLMFPLACAVADDIRIAGADGRQPTENYFWQHNRTLQYSDELMRTVFDSHPAFFRDRDYTDYYDQYCSDVEDLAQFAEAHGKTVRAAAPSWIPALVKRGAGRPATD